MNDIKKEICIVPINDSNKLEVCIYEDARSGYIKSVSVHGINGIKTEVIVSRLTHPLPLYGVCDIKLYSKDNDAILESIENMIKQYMHSNTSPFSWNTAIDVNEFYTSIIDRVINYFYTKDDMVVCEVCINDTNYIELSCKTDSDGYIVRFIVSGYEDNMLDSHKGIDVPDNFPKTKLSNDVNYRLTKTVTTIITERVSVMTEPFSWDTVVLVYDFYADVLSAIVSSCLDNPKPSEDINDIIINNIQEKILDDIVIGDEIIKLFQPLVDSINGICHSINVSVSINEYNVILINDCNSTGIETGYIIHANFTEFLALDDNPAIINEIMTSLFNEQQFLVWLKAVVLRGRHNINRVNPNTIVNVGNFTL